MITDNSSQTTAKPKRTMKTIPLTQGLEAIVDDSDFEWLSQFHWYAVRLGNRKTPYAAMSVNKRHVLLHRHILNETGRIRVDHINGNTLDDQRHNLRRCTHQQNCFNKSNTTKKLGKITRFKGVCWHRRIEKWQANICLNRQKVHIGYFDSEELAAEAYNQKAKELFGEFAALNNLARKPGECIKSPLDA